MRNLEYWGLDSTTPITHYVLPISLFLPLMNVSLPMYSKRPRLFRS